MNEVQVARGRGSGTGRAGTADVRDLVRASWQRSRQSGLHPDRTLPPLVAAEDEVEEWRRGHVLASVWPLLAETLRPAISEPGSMLLVTDTDGKVLWAEGEATTRRIAERVHLVPGSVWGEESAGTNGLGVALRLRRPVQITGREHYLSAVSAYTCIAVPIRQPDTGELIGAVDLTIGAQERASMGRSLVTMAARLAETRLRELRLRDEARLRQRYADRLSRRLGSRSAVVAEDGRVLESDPPGWLPRRLPTLGGEGSHVLPDGQQVLVERLVAGGPFLVMAHPRLSGPAYAVEGSSRLELPQRSRLEALGRERALLRIDGVTHELSRRHSEIITALLTNPGGLGADALTAEVYGPEGKAITLRAELARLRPILGHRLASQPYRLTEPFDTDFGALEEELQTGELAAVLDRYLGPLLPGSHAPAVLAVRDRMHSRVRTLVLDSGDADALARWTATPHGRADSAA